MSSGCGDVLSLQDLKTAKLHQTFEAEVITGRVGGAATGASIDYATNPVTLQVQKTMPAILRDIGFQPASFDFTTGGTLTTSDRNKAVLWTLASGGDGDWYYWEGALPKVIPAASTPASTGGVAEGAWRPVGDITLRREISDPEGATLYPDLQIARWRDEGDVRGWGAVGDGVTDDATSISAAIQAMVSRGGGVVRYPAGVFRTSLSQILYENVYHIGSGRGATTVKPTDGSNIDVFVSERFSSLTGVGPLINAPKNFGISNLTVDGNYQADYKSSSIGGDTTVVNSSGYGVKVFGSKYHFDIEIVNCAQVGFYTEAVDYTGYGYEQDCTVSLSGRVYGKEAFVDRGPADANWGHIVMGCPGWLATEAQRQAGIVTSDLYPGEPVHVMVSDEQAVGSLAYNGHHDFTYLHLYGNYSGLGYKAMNSGRLNGAHMKCENCRGGAYFGPRVWGEIATLQCHSNGRNPSGVAGTLSMLPDIDIASLQGFTVRATVRRNQSEAGSWLALRSSGHLTRVDLNYYVINTVPTNSPVADITSENGVYDIILAGVNGDAVSVAGVGNTVRINGREVTNGSLVKRVGGTSSANRSNDITVNARNCANVLNLDGLVTTESIKILAELNSGQTVVSGSAIDMVSRGISLDIAARINGVLATSYDVGRINLDNTVTTEQVIAVNHNYFQVPDAAQISVSIYDPTPTYGGVLEYTPRIQTITATQITFVYKLSSIGTGGPLVLCWRIQ